MITITQTQTMMKKSIITIITITFALLVNTKAEAQQDPNFTLYNFNMNLINPAYAGSKDTSEINLSYRSQWIGVENAPSTQLLSYTSPLKKNLGIGVSIINDKIFILRETYVSTDLSYKLKVSSSHDLFFGVKFGAGFINLDLKDAGAPEDDPLFANNQSFYNAHIGAGLYLKHKNYYVTISTPNLLKEKHYQNQGDAERISINSLHMYYGAGYHFAINENVKITPAVMHRSTQGAPSSTDVNATVQYNKIQAGMNYRVDEMYSIFTMFNMTKYLRFGASYDFTTSEINTINDNGSIELLIRYQF